MVSRTIVFVLVVIFQCIPVALSWDTTIDGKCANSQAFVYVAAGVSIVEDVVIMLLPIWELNDLSLSLKKRLILVFMFAIGSL